MSLKINAPAPYGFKNTPDLKQSGAAKAPAPTGMPKGSPDPSKASTPDNLKTTFGLPTKQK